MRIDIATLFPEMCEAVLCESIIGRAREAGLLEVYCHNIRDYTQDKHRRVDDTPYGGGMGMVMQADPIFRCYEAVCAQLPQKPHVIYLSPQGKVLTQQMAVEYSRQQYCFCFAATTREWTSGCWRRSWTRSFPSAIMYSPAGSCPRWCLWIPWAAV